MFFIDEDQAVVKNDFATIDRIRDAAERMHSKVIEGSALELKTQFRVAGGEMYISFIKSFLGYNQDVMSYHPKQYEFKVFDSAAEMRQAIREKDDQFNDNHAICGKCRIVAGYTYEWVSKGQYRDGFDYDIILDDGSRI